MSGTNTSPTSAAGADAADRFRRSRELKARLQELVPGGGHTYAKGDDQFPQLAPGLIARGNGCHVWDVDGNEFIEYGMGQFIGFLDIFEVPFLEPSFFPSSSSLELRATTDADWAFR
jgi:hypothetical protein